MKSLYILLLVLVCTVIKTNAQIVDISRDSLYAPPENVVIYKDPRLDVLDTRPTLLARAEAVEKAKEKEREKENTLPLYNPIVSADGKKKVTGSIYKSKGFRVIIYNGPDREKAMEAKNMFMRAFPSVPTYMTYNVPSYKIKVGNFDDRKEASNFLRKVSSSFPASFIVPDIVTIKNINVTN